MTANVDEIAPDLFRISVFAPAGDLQFNHFLVRDEQPLLFHTGLRGMFTEVREAVQRLIDLKQLRHIAFSHFESDECGSLNEWLALAPQAQVTCSEVGALVCVNDFIGRPARPLHDGATFSTGKYLFRYCQTPHLPHGWDAGVLFEETQKTLLCSDLFHQTGDVEPLTEADIVGRTARPCASTSPASWPTTSPTPRSPATCCSAWPRSSPVPWPSCMAPASAATPPAPSAISTTSSVKSSAATPNRNRSLP